MSSSREMQWARLRMTSSSATLPQQCFPRQRKRDALQSRNARLLQICYQKTHRRLTAWFYMDHSRADACGCALRGGLPPPLPATKVLQRPRIFRTLEIDRVNLALQYAPRAVSTPQRRPYPPVATAGLTYTQGISRRFFAALQKASSGVEISGSGSAQSPVTTRDAADETAPQLSPRRRRLLALECVSRERSALPGFCVSAALPGEGGPL